MAPQHAETLDDNPPEAMLDAGLRVAFGPAESVFDEDAGDLGGETRIVLPGPGAGTAAAATASPGERYQVRDEIGHGGMGVIVRTHDANLGRDVAMKILHPRHAANQDMVKRFVEEARIAGQLQHPGVLQIYELGLKSDQRPYFTMKLIKGRTLAAILEARAEPGLERRRFLSIFEDICQTMAYAHARGVIHRDLKPANVMVGNFGEVQIVDWGLAKLVDRASGAPETETVIRTGLPRDAGTESQTGSVMGTPAYMPPEQARGEIDRLDARCDVFALGAILCEILTGHPPYGGADALAMACRGDLDRAFERLEASETDTDLVDLARRCLEPEVDARPAHGGEVAAAITSYLASVEERARALELSAAEARARAVHERRARRLTVALGLSVLAVIVVVAGSFISFQHDRLRQMAASSRQAEEQLAALEPLLEKARQTPVASDAIPWVALRYAGANLAALREAARMDKETRTRVDTFLDEFASVDRDRRMVERIEELVIFAATHEDRASWVRTEARLREAFREYGIDLETTGHDEIARLIRESDMPALLADGLELWIATVAHLGTMGTPLLDRDQLLAWMEVLYVADPDPFRTAIRHEIASGQPDPEALAALRESPEFERALPRTLAWLGDAFYLAGDIEGMDAVFQRALFLHLNDVMLNIDYGLHLKTLERWEEAESHFRTALGVRREEGGLWRSRGIVLREIGRLDDAIMAFKKSIIYEPSYAPTHLDLGLTFAQFGDVDTAIESYRDALEIRPDLAEAHLRLGLALQEKGRLDGRQ